MPAFLDRHLSCWLTMLSLNDRPMWGFLISHTSHEWSSCFLTLSDWYSFRMRLHHTISKAQSELVSDDPLTLRRLRTREPCPERAPNHTLQGSPLSYRYLLVCSLILKLEDLLAGFMQQCPINAEHILKGRRSGAVFMVGYPGR